LVQKHQNRTSRFGRASIARRTKARIACVLQNAAKPAIHRNANSLICGGIVHDQDLRLWRKAPYGFQACADIRLTFKGRND
jgi:hypothetical protein